MQWEGGEESKNVEDRRGIHPGLIIGGGGGIIVAILALIFGVDPGNFFGPNGGGQKGGAEEDRMAEFSSKILRNTEIVWEDQFQKNGKGHYKQPKMQLFTGSTNTGCGAADSGIGPFYCPADSTVYLDVSFFIVLDKQLGAPGEFARAYVIAHEVGHHVQRLLKYSIEDVRRTGTKTQFNQASVRLELQADYFAGVWAHHAREKFPNMLEKGDLESATNAAFRIGDDHLQQEARGQVQKDSFTHGTSAQRQKWFLEGFRTGSMDGAKQLFDLPYNRL